MWISNCAKSNRLAPSAGSTSRSTSLVLVVSTSGNRSEHSNGSNAIHGGDPVDEIGTFENAGQQRCGTGRRFEEATVFAVRREYGFRLAMEAENHRIRCRIGTKALQDL